VAQAGPAEPAPKNGASTQLFNSLTRFLQERLPPRKDILQVFGVVLFAVFGWSIRGFLYKVPAFTLYFGLISNMSILGYMLAFALLESILVTGILLMLSVALPARSLREGFAYKGFLIIFVAAIAMILFEWWFQIGFFKDILAGQYYMVPTFVSGLVLCIAALLLLLWLFRARPRFQSYVLYAAEQLGIFTYIYVPLGVIGLVVVILRNIP
jgi:hypothetical protein